MPVSNPDIHRHGEEPLLPSPERNFVLGPIPGTLHHPLVTLAWQLMSCAFAWSFIIVLACKPERVIPLSGELLSLICRYPTEKTLIATLIATIVSTATTWYFLCFSLCSTIES